MRGASGTLTGGSRSPRPSSGGPLWPAGQIEVAEPEQVAEQRFSSGKGEVSAGKKQDQDDVEGEWIEVKRKGRKLREGGKTQSQ